MLGAFVHTIGVVLQATSFSLPQLIVGRFVSGLGFGALSATAPNWQSECSKAEHRGAVVLYESVFISIGLAMVSWIEFGMSHTTGSVSWRFPVAFAGFWSIVVLLIIPRMSESPRWLLKKGRVAEAREVMSALDDVPLNSEQITEKIREMEESLAISGNGRFRDVFHNGPERLFHRTCLAAAGQFFQQWCGINALAFYLAVIFQQDLGLTGQDASILGAAVFTWATVCAPIGVLTVDRLGRRKLMITASIRMGICMAVLAGTVSQPNNRAAIITGGTFIFLFNLYFPVGFLGLTFLYASEIAPLSVRVPITSISTGTAWLFNFVVAEITPYAFANLKARYYIVYAVMNLCLIVPGVYFFFPETNGRTLEEVDEIFIQSKSIFDTVKISHELPRQRLNHDAESVSGSKEQAKDTA